MSDDEKKPFFIKRRQFPCPENDYNGNWIGYMIGLRFSVQPLSQPKGKVFFKDRFENGSDIPKNQEILDQEADIGVNTTADMALEQVRENVKEALRGLSNILIEECWGHDEYRD